MKESDRTEYQIKADFTVEFLRAAHLQALEF